MADPVFIATRGSALALAQARLVQSLCRGAFPAREFELRIIKTTGDKLQTASLANPDASLPKGLFTKEIEEALLARAATLAVHSLKDLPTQLPAGLVLGGALPREDARDVLVLRGVERPADPHALPDQLAVATSSTRRQAQLQHHRPGWSFREIRGNVGTRLNKLAAASDFDATILAAAGMKRLGYRWDDKGRLAGEEVPAGLTCLPLPADWMIPAVGQAAIGIEIHAEDDLGRELCAALNDPGTWHCVTAERAFLAAMGGGCQSPVAAHATLADARLHLRAVSFQVEPARWAAGEAKPGAATALGRQLAAQIHSPEPPAPTLSFPGTP